MNDFDNQSGKVSAQFFKEDLLNSCGALRSEVICGPSFGVDTAIIDLGANQALAVSSDPLSLIPSLGMKVSAWLSVHLLVNDMSTTGFAPQYAQFVLNLPMNLSREQFNDYWKNIHELCCELDIAITGGHTGKIPGQTSTISGGGTMFLKAPRESILTSDQASEGDSIIVTKYAALSSTALLAMAFPETVKKTYGAEVQKRAASNFWNLSVLPESLMATSTLQPNVEIHAMHDVTEGGILGALVEMAEASNCGFKVNLKAIPTNPDAQKVATLFDIDPLFSIGAGSMIIAVKKGTESKLIQQLTKNGIQAAHVGEFTKNPNKELINNNGISTPVNFDGVDPYWGAFFNALQAGWK